MKNILEQASETVVERGKVYGSPAKDFETVAKLWSAYLELEIQAHQVPAMMMLLKIARLSQTPDHYDSNLDIAGYAWCYQQVIEDDAMQALAEQERRKPRPNGYNFSQIHDRVNAAENMQRAELGDGADSILRALAEDILGEEKANG